DVPESTELFPRTPIAGDMTADTVVIVLHTVDTAPPTLWVWHEDGTLVLQQEVAPDAHGFAKVRVDGLEAGTWYRHVLTAGPADAPTARGLVGRVRTALAPGVSEPVRIVLSSCIGRGSVIPDFVMPDQAEPFRWDLMEMAGQLDFDAFVQLGDQGYFDFIWDAGPTYEAYLEAWGAYHAGGYRDVFPRAGVLATWDDHEVADNGTFHPATSDPDVRAGIEAAQRAWFTVMPIDADAPGDATVWRSFRWGDTVELVLLDCRYEKTEGEPPHLVSEAQLAWLLERLTTS
ncbi:MAG: alkaline phosphatase D family protein, partial [Myxococcales bacterium]|nr:alkaline phosphatase D family protein [Myxococcales bacterium]